MDGSDKENKEDVSCLVLGFCWVCGSEEKLLVSTRLRTVTCLTCNQEHTLVYFRQLERDRMDDNIEGRDEQAKTDELFSRLWQLHFKIEGFYPQMPTSELKDAINSLCTAIEYCFCLYSPSIAESTLRDKLVSDRS